MCKGMNKVRLSKEDKELVFRDLSARLPYGVRVKVWLKGGDTEEGVLDLVHNYGDVLRDAFYLNKIVDIKPYLRPMSEMTEKEKKMYRRFGSFEVSLEFELEEILEVFYMFNRNHLDFRGLIGKWLALQAPKGMYDIK